MLVVPDLPMTQQYKPFAKAAIEHVSIFDSFQNLTMRNNEYMDVIMSNTLALQNTLRKPSPIERKINEMTFLGNWDITNQENKLSSLEVNSMSMLISSYKKEIQRVKDRFSSLLESSGHIFSHVSRKLYKLPFQNCAVEVSSDETMKFTLSFANDRLLMLTKHINPEKIGLSKDQIMYSFFINRKLIASDVTNLEVFTKNFKGYVSI